MQVMALTASMKVKSTHPQEIITKIGCIFVHFS